MSLCSLKRFWCAPRPTKSLFLLDLLDEPQSKAPKAVISMKDLNAVFQPEKICHSHGLQISYTQGERMRNLFVYHEDGQVCASVSEFRGVSVFFFHPAACLARR